MMRRVQVGRLAAVAALALLAGLSGRARADYAYGFASQTISGVTITPAAGTRTPVGGVTTSSTANSTFNGSGPSTSDVLDALQSFSGPTAPAPQNDFAKYATFAVASPLPAGTQPTGPGEFGRGDSLISGLGTANNAGSVVGESFRTTVGSATGGGEVTASQSFTLSTATTLAINYTFASDIYVSTGGAGSSASAAYGFNITIKDAGGAIVFTMSTDNTNTTLAAPPQGGEIIRSGNETVTTTSLAVGTTYTLIFTVNATTSARVRAVPEPGSIALLTTGGLGAAGLFLRRRRRTAA